MLGEGEMAVGAATWRLPRLQMLARLGIRVVLKRAVAGLALLLLDSGVLLGAALLVLKAGEVLDPLREGLAPRSV